MFPVERKRDIFKTSYAIKMTIILLFVVYDQNKKL